VALGFGLGPIFSESRTGNTIFSFWALACLHGYFFTGVFAGIQVIWDWHSGFFKGKHGRRLLRAMNYDG